MSRATPGSVVDLLQQYARPSASFTDSVSRREIDKLCEISKHVLLEKTRDLLLRRGNGYPVVKFYSSDGTPLLMNKAWTKALGAKIIVRHGKKSTEYLLERTHLKTRDEQDNDIFAVCFRDPTPLEGKSGWHLFACLQESSPSLRSMGVRGPTISHYVWDRGCFSVLDRLVRKAHRYDGSSSGEADAALQMLLDFVFTRPDACHDCGTAFAWSLKGVSTPELAKDVFIVLSPLRNAYNILMENMTLWLPTVLFFASAQDLPSDGVLSRLWSALDIEDDISSALIEIGLLFKGGRLHVKAEFRGQAGFFDRLISILMAVWRFINYSDSRWLTIGPSTRSLNASLLTGVESLVTFSRQVRKCSEYYIHGFDRLSAEVRALSIVASLSSAVAESLLAEVLDDDRVMTRVEYLEEMVGLEWQALDSMPSEVWCIIGSIVPSVGEQELRSKTMQAALVTRGHLNEKIFEDTRSLPWSLCRGDKQANLERLRGAPRPAEPTASQMWDLMQRGFPVNSLVTIVEEAALLPWSSTGVEQAHAGAAQVMKHHPEFHQSSMQARSMVYNMRSVVSDESHVVKLHKLQAKLDAVSRMRPRCITGRHIFLADCFSVASSLLGAGDQISPESRKELMRTHTEAFMELDIDTRTAYAMRAKTKVEDRHYALCQQRRALQDEVDLLTMRAEDDMASQNPWRLSSCKFSQEDKRRMEVLWQDSRFSRSKVEELRKQASVAPPIQDIMYRMAISREFLPRSVLPALPAWVGQVASHRDAFAFCALAVKVGEVDEGDVVFYEVLYAYQSPVSLCVAKLRRRGEGRLHLAGRLADAMRLHWDFDFVVENKFEYSFGEAMCSWSVDKMSVLPSLVHLSGGRVVSAADLMSFEAYLESLPPLPDRRARQGAAAQPAAHAANARAAILAEHPWALRYLSEGRDILRRQRARAGHSGADDEPEDEDDYVELEVEQPMVLAKAALDEVADALAKARHYASADHLGTFRVAPLGGPWTARHAGVAMDAWAGRAVGKAVEEWCRKYSLQDNMRFDVSLYTPEGALTCARYWALKHWHYHEIWLGEGSPAEYKYTEEDHASFIEPEAFTKLAETVVAVKAQRRFELLRGLRPLGSGTL